MKILHVVGARPNFMKAAPLMEAFSRHNALHAGNPIEQTLVHTGQHYDEKMCRLFFEDLGLPKPDMDLEVGSGSHAQQTAEVMKRFEPVVLERNPDWVVVVGDVNSTIACALTAVKLGIKVAHVEAGLRSGDRSMPEEINRILTDAIACLLFTTSRQASDNLRAEGIPLERIHFAGNTMIDSLLKHRARAKRPSFMEKTGWEEFTVMTLHRPSNVDDGAAFGGIVDALQRLQDSMPVVFPIHPRTRKMAAHFDLLEKLQNMSNLALVEPQGYLEFLYLMAHAKLILTDSGGIQEESTVLGVPCLTLRPNTERPETITEGTNTLVGNSAAGIVAAAEAALNGRGKAGRIPERWDGRAAERIVEVFLNGTS
jgi:UDP-N-acetylglucosamine 2-epimerase (non-hydrolysing)